VYPHPYVAAELNRQTTTAAASTPAQTLMEPAPAAMSRRLAHVWAGQAQDQNIGGSLR